jgi:guanylate kinase
MIFAIVGKTASGKDTIARHISETFHLPIICSATTRPMRDYETNGKEHWFVTKEQMAEMKNSPNVIAYTKMPYTGIEYAATTDMVKGYSDMIYVINPEGIRWFKENGTKNQTMLSIYVDLPDSMIVDRAVKRGDRMCDVMDRLASESKEMNEFRDKHKYNLYVDNSGALSSTLDRVDRFVAFHLEERGSDRQKELADGYLRRSREAVEKEMEEDVCER